MKGKHKRNHNTNVAVITGQLAHSLQYKTPSNKRFIIEPMRKKSMAYYIIICFEYLKEVKVEGNKTSERERMGEKDN